MGAIASQITSLTIVYSTVYSDTDQRKHQSSASLAILWGIHREPVNSPHKWPVTRKMFPFDDVIMTAEEWLSAAWSLVPMRPFGHLMPHSIGRVAQRHGRCEELMSMIKMITACQMPGMFITEKNITAYTDFLWHSRFWAFAQTYIIVNDWQNLDDKLKTATSKLSKNYNSIFMFPFVYNPIR